MYVLKLKINDDRKLEKAIEEFKIDLDCNDSKETCAKSEGNVFKIADNEGKK